MHVQQGDYVGVGVHGAQGVNFSLHVHRQGIALLQMHVFQGHELSCGFVLGAVNLRGGGGGGGS